MKHSILFLLCTGFGFYAAAQSVEGTTDYNKTKQPAVVCEYPYPPALVETILTDDLKQKGFGKGKSSKGFDVYQAINFTEISTDKIDFYVRVERKGRKEKDIAIVTIMVSKGYDNFISGGADASIMQNTMAYINGLKPKLEKSSLEIQIADQEEVLKKEEKKMSGLVDDLEGLEKKKKKLEQDMEDNKKDQEKQKAEVEKQKGILESIKAQRKN
jgi:hypothetical protein